jgi:hypothetical protein
MSCRRGWGKVVEVLSFAIWIPEADSFAELCREWPWVGGVGCATTGFREEEEEEEVIVGGCWCWLPVREEASSLRRTGRVWFRSSLWFGLRDRYRRGRATAT